MSKNDESIADLIRDNIEQLRGFIPEYNVEAKPLSDKSKDKVWKYLKNKIYNKYDSWVVDAIIRWAEKNIPVSTVKEELKGAVQHFGPQSHSAIVKGIEQANEGFKKKGRFNMLENIKSTFKGCANKVLDQSSENLCNFANKVRHQYTKTEKSEQTQVA